MRPSMLSALFKTMLAGMLLVLLCGCSPLKVLNSLTPTSTFTRVTDISSLLRGSAPYATSVTRVKVLVGVRELSTFNGEQPHSSTSNIPASIVLNSALNMLGLMDVYSGGIRDNSYDFSGCQ